MRGRFNDSRSNIEQCLIVQVDVTENNYIITTVAKILVVMKIGLPRLINRRFLHLFGHPKKAKTAKQCSFFVAYFTHLTRHKK
jgi:hypothetical protein